MRQDATREVRGVRAPSLAPDELEARRKRRVSAYPAPVRPAVERLARLAPAIEDIAESFPGLLFALATGFGDDKARTSALAAIMEGQPLRAIADGLGLPFWLRKLPASAFHAPLDRPPADPQLTSRLVSLIPPTPAAAAAWLDRVLTAHRTGRSDLTLWVAQSYRAPQPSARSAAFLSVLAWAWYSGSEPQSRAAKLLTARWQPSLGTKRATEEARLWRERLALDVVLGNGLSDTWLEEGSHAGMTFKALRTADDFIAEARAMDNCLDRYADRLVGRPARVFAVRRDGSSIATIEISSHESEPGHPVISQLRGPHNRRAPLDVWQAAYAWIGSQSLRLADKRLVVRSNGASCNRRREELWHSFLEALPQHAREQARSVLLGKARKAGQQRAGSSS